MQYMIKLFPEDRADQLRGHLGKLGLGGNLALQVIGSLSGASASHVGWVGVRVGGCVGGCMGGGMGRWEGGDGGVNIRGGEYWFVCLFVWGCKTLFFISSLPQVWVGWGGVWVGCG